MRKKKFKRISSILLVLLLLFIMLIACDGNGLNSTSTVTTATEEEIMKQSLMQEWQSVVMERSASVAYVYHKLPLTSSFYSVPIKEHEPIQAVLTYLKELDVSFVDIKMVDVASYSKDLNYDGYVFYSAEPTSSLVAIPETDQYFSISLSSDGVLRLRDPAHRWELFTAPGAVDYYSFGSFMKQYFYH